MKIKDIKINEGKIRGKYIVYVEKRGIGLTKTADLRFHILEGSAGSLVQAIWYEDEKDRRNDIAVDRIFTDKQDFYKYVDNYVDVRFEEVSIVDLARKNRNLPVEALKQDGIIVESWDWGRTEEFKKWISNKEDGRDYTVVLEDEGIVDLEELELKVFDLKI